MKNVLTPITLINAGSMAGNLTSAAIDTTFLDDMGVHFIWTGSPTGTLAVNASNDNVNFFALTFNPAITQPAGSASNTGAAIITFPWKWIQVSYTASTGSGSLTALLTGKAI